MDTLAQTLAEVEVEKPADTLFHVKAMGMVDVLAYTECYEGETLFE